MFVVGFWWGNLWARQPGRGVLQGQHSDHAAPAWQLDPMDFRHQREFLLSHRIVKHVTFRSLCPSSLVMVLMWPWFFLSSSGGWRRWDQGSCCPERIRRGSVRCTGSPDLMRLLMLGSDQDRCCSWILIAYLLVYLVVVFHHRTHQCMRWSCCYCCCFN